MPLSWVLLSHSIQSLGARPGGTCTHEEAPLALLFMTTQSLAIGVKAVDQPIFMQFLPINLEWWYVTDHQSVFLRTGVPNACLGPSVGVYSMNLKNTKCPLRYVFFLSFIGA